MRNLRGCKFSQATIVPDYFYLRMNILLKNFVYNLNAASEGSIMTSMITEESNIYYLDYNRNGNPTVLLLHGLGVDGSS